MIGLENIREYYTDHYVAEVLSNDLGPLLDRLPAQAPI